MINISYFKDKSIKFSTNESKYWFIKNSANITEINLNKFYEGLEIEDVDLGYPYLKFVNGIFDFSRVTYMEKQIPFEKSLLYIYFKPDSSFSSFLEYKLSISENKTEILSKLKETNPKLLEREGLL